MPSITVQTLTLCIQAVAAEICQLKIDRDSAEGHAQADYDELLLAYSLAAMDLKKAYLKQRSRVTSPEHPGVLDYDKLAGEGAK